MSNRGYLYALINLSMPGLVKVGRTERDPTNRAAELSGATGVATPFIVAYHQLFSDCHEAEHFVHAYLEAKGVRVATNREFFTASLPDVVKAIAIAPGAIDLDGDDAEPEEADELLTGCGDDPELAELTLSPRAPWADVFEEATDYYYGSNDELEDYPRAMNMFRQAAKLGCVEAYRYLGDMYRQGEGVQENNRKALEYYREGVRQGDVLCYGRMAVIFALEEERENEAKCWRLFFKAISEDGIESTSSPHTAILLMADHVFYRLMKDRPVEYRDVLAQYSSEILDHFETGEEAHPGMFTRAVLWSRMIHSRRKLSESLPATVSTDTAVQLNNPMEASTRSAPAPVWPPKPKGFWRKFWGDV